MLLFDVSCHYRHHQTSIWFLRWFQSRIEPRCQIETGATRYSVHASRLSCCKPIWTCKKNQWKRIFPRKISRQSSWRTAVCWLHVQMAMRHFFGVFEQLGETARCWILLEDVITEKLQGNSSALRWRNYMKNHFWKVWCRAKATTATALCTRASCRWWVRTCILARAAEAVFVWTQRLAARGWAWIIDHRATTFAQEMWFECSQVILPGWIDSCHRTRSMASLDGSCAKCKEQQETIIGRPLPKLV